MSRVPHIASPPQGDNYWFSMTVLKPTSQKQAKISKAGSRVKPIVLLNTNGIFLDPNLHEEN